MKSFVCTTAAAATISLLVLITSITNTESCSCMPKHPQQHFCDSHFVILARIKRTTTTPYAKIYKIRIRKEYKMSEKAVVALEYGRILTPLESSMCGVVDLKVGELYVISGQITSLKARINQCNFIKEWKHLTNRQRKGFKRMYHHGCHCNVRSCFYGHCGKSKNECTWKKPFYNTGTCLSKYGFCLRSAHKNCIWVKNAALNTCMRNSTISMSELL